MTTTEPTPPTPPAAEYTRIRVEQPAEHVTRVVLARADAANAQDKRMLYELDAALTAASADDDTHAIVVAADGVHFSSGHDLRDREDVRDFDHVTPWGQFHAPGQEGHFGVEQEMYLGLCWRWRNIPKPTIVAVQGKVIAGGLMLVWPFDLIVAADDAQFCDPVVAFGVNGHEFFVHPYEVGARKAKQMLFTGEPMSAAEAHRLGMVNELVPRAELEEATLRLARKVARMPLMGLKLSKLSVNMALDNMGMWNTVSAALGYHHLGHSNAQQIWNLPVNPDGADRIRKLVRGEEA